MLISLRDILGTNNKWLMASLLLFSLIFVIGLYSNSGVWAILGAIPVSLFLLFKFFFGKYRLHPFFIFVSLWIVAGAVSQLYLTPLEEKWTPLFTSTYLILILLFALGTWVGRKLKLIGLVKHIVDTASNKNKFHVVLWVLAVLSVLINIYVYISVGTIPIVSSDPDRARSFISSELFGPLQWGALLARVYLPLTILFILMFKDLMRLKDWFSVAGVIFIGLVTASLYVSRGHLIIPIVISYFIYLYFHRERLNLKQIILPTVAILIITAFIFVGMQAFRQYVSYIIPKDEIAKSIDEVVEQQRKKKLKESTESATLNDDEEELVKEAINSSYLQRATKSNLPENLGWVLSPYIVLSYNLQTFQAATVSYNWTGADTNGKYLYKELSGLGGKFGINLPNPAPNFGDLYTHWWVTGSFFFNYYYDFGILGVLFIAFAYGVLLSYGYRLFSTSKTILGLYGASILMIIALFSLHSDYLIRPELYLDAALLLLVSHLVKEKYANRN